MIDRPGFMFNPTNCNPQAFSGTATQHRRRDAPRSQATSRSARARPEVRAGLQSLDGGEDHRKANGASLTAKIVYPTGPLGANQASSQSNIARVKVDLPKQLPSRLTTLQKACTAAQFEANPAGCPAASVVGHATAVTPVLPVPLKGPAYLRLATVAKRSRA